MLQKTPPLDLRTISSATAEELSQLHKTAQSLQAMLGDFVSKESTLSSDVISEIQSLDYLTQSLQELSLFWTEMSLQAPDRFDLGSDEAAKNIRLRDLSNRLRGVLPSVPSNDAELEASELF